MFLLNLLHIVRANSRLALKDLLENFWVWHLIRIVSLQSLHHKISIVARTFRTASLAHGSLSRILLDLLSGHSVSQLLLVIFKDFFSFLFLFLICAHHGVEDHLPAPPTDKQLEGRILILFKFELTSCQLLEEIINSSSLVATIVALLTAASLDN